MQNQKSGGSVFGYKQSTTVYRGRLPVACRSLPAVYRGRQSTQQSTVYHSLPVDGRHFRPQQAARPGIERARAWGRGGTFLLRRRLARVASHHRRVLHHDARSLVALEAACWHRSVGRGLCSGEIGAGERETLETDGRPSLFGQLAYIAFTLVLSLTGGKSTPYNTSWHGPTAP